MMDIAAIFKEQTRYQIKREAGSGGMGTVFETYDRKLDRMVALKILHKTTEKEQTRALREARAQAKVEHPNICKLFEIGTQEKHPYIAMQYIQGGDLTTYSEQLSLEQKVSIAIKVALALHESHRSGLIHRDIKPSNILVEENKDGDLEPYITDFGLAQVLDQPGMTQEQIAGGTPYYMSPEQINGEYSSIDRRSDVYGLGVTLYEVLSGEMPFPGPSGIEVLFQILNKEPIPIRKNLSLIPQDLETIVMKCIEKDPNQRFQSTKALAEDLQRYLDGDPVLAHKAGLGYRLKRKIMKNKAQSLIIGIFSIFLLTLFSLWIHSRYTANEQARLAQYFGQQAAELEAEMRFISMLPRQDIVDERAKLLRAIQVLEKQCAGMKKLGQGPGYFAVGSSYFSLQEYQKARVSLEKAWRLGYQNPEVAFSLGQTLKSLYEKAWYEAQKIENITIREKQLADAEKNLRTPALEYLKFPGSSQSLYQEALLADLEGNEDLAIAKATQATLQTPWSYESLLLKGQIFMEQAESKWAKGAYDEAGILFELAESDLMKSQAIAECDIRSYQELLTLWEKKISSELYSKGNDIHLVMEKAQDVAEQAFEVIPNHADITVIFANIELWFAEYQMKKGEEAKLWIDSAREKVLNSLDKRSETTALHNTLASSFLLEGELLMSQGKPALPAFFEAIKQFKVALSLSPQNEDILNKMGLTYWNVAIYQLFHGENPLDSLEKAVQSFIKITSLVSDNSSAFNNLGNAFGLKAHYEDMAGVDPEQSLIESMEYYKKSIEINTNFTYGYNNLGTAYLNLGTNESFKGRSPLDYFEKAIKVFQKALELNPEYQSPYRNLATIYAQKAEYEFGEGLDPNESLDQGEYYCQLAIQKNPKHLVAYSVLIGLQEKKIRFLNPTIESLALMFEKGLSAFKTAEGINARDQSTLSSIAELHLTRSKDPRLSVAQREFSLKEARSHLETMELLNPKNFKVYLGYGQVEIQNGFMLLDAGKNPELAWVKAEQWVEKAMELNQTSQMVLELRARVLYVQAKHLILNRKERLKKINAALESGLFDGDSKIENGDELYSELLELKKALAE